MSRARRAPRAPVLALVLGLALGTLVAPNPAVATSAPAPRQCATRDLSGVLWTNAAAYGRGASVRVTLLVRNSSSGACAVAYGASTPSVRVRDGAGHLAFAPCVNQPCAQFLARRTLRPGQWLRRTWTWTPGATNGVDSPGTYRVSARAYGLAVRPVTVRLASRGAKPSVIARLSRTRVTLVRGATLVLLGARGRYTYSSPAASSSALVPLVALGGASVVGAFHARSRGLVTLRVTATPACYPQCLQPSRLYTISVRVRR